ncbi:uncharacterized protein F5891DRAFT_507857 [Suillus fuscotomentosus]|uniref:Uncharacterized protein n=1 Tax=Suillus fuscotomentosus TaxID=1912939 RepID=A0AAD4E3I5_9AGAM|nr:uncharacterized protein F5891DRAFT_507857 [Suillus fuscotomentosus]KAG1897844.1 hypothetical protein F5891DRAFT_507857 [Suillus fuscotomentosus]
MSSLTSLKTIKDIKQLQIDTALRVTYGKSTPHPGSSTSTKYSSTSRRSCDLGLRLPVVCSFRTKKWPMDYSGSDTTAVAIMYVVMSSPCYTEAQEKVSQQLDIVVGRDRGMLKLILVNKFQLLYLLTMLRPISFIKA